ncbi:hypothetical protein ACN28I_28805 [Archangium gephyra]|uniref:hypothetical protein n=1 Tax=Archangium gephyra TaxID=48 RepID=UPI003B7E7B3A
MRDTFSSSPPRVAPVFSGPRAVLLALGLWLAGCGVGESPPPAPPPRLEVGTGRHFTVLGEGATLELVRGSQGSQHVFVSLRAWDLTPLTARVTLSLARTEDGLRVSSPYEVRLPFEAATTPDAPAELEGLLLVVPDPSPALGREVRLTASIETQSGERATDTRSATLQWGATSP